MIENVPTKDWKCIDCGKLAKPDEWAGKHRCIDCGPTEEELDNDQNDNS